MNEKLSSNIFCLNWNSYSHTPIPTDSKCSNETHKSKVPTLIQTLTPENIAKVYEEITSQQQKTGTVTSYDLYLKLKNFLSDAQRKQILNSIIKTKLTDLTHIDLSKHACDLEAALDSKTIPNLEATILDLTLLETQVLETDPQVVANSVEKLSNIATGLGLRRVKRFKSPKVSTKWLQNKLAETGYSFCFLSDLDKDSCCYPFEKVKRHVKPVKSAKHKEHVFKWDLNGTCHLNCPCSTKIHMKHQDDAELHDLWIASQAGVPQLRVNVEQGRISLDQINPGTYKIICKNHADHSLVVTTSTTAERVSQVQVQPNERLITWNLMKNASWPQNITIPAGTTIKFNSNDDLEHDIVLANPQFQKLSVAPLASGTNINLSKEFVTPGVMYFVDSKHPNINLRIQVLDGPMALTESICKDLKHAHRKEHVKKNKVDQVVTDRVTVDRTLTNQALANQVRETQNLVNQARTNQNLVNQVRTNQTPLVNQAPRFNMPQTDQIMNTINSFMGRLNLTNPTMSTVQNMVNDVAAAVNGVSNGATRVPAVANALVNQTTPATPTTPTNIVNQIIGRIQEGTRQIASPTTSTASTTTTPTNIVNQIVERVQETARQIASPTTSPATSATSPTLLPTPTKLSCKHIDNFGVYQTPNNTHNIPIENILPSLPKPFVYRRAFIDCFRKWVIVDQALKRMKLTSSQDLIQHAKDETVELLSKSTVSDILKSSLNNPEIRRLKREISNSALARLTAQHLSTGTDASKLEIKALNAWYHLDRKYAQNALAQSINSQGQINEAELQKLLEQRLVQNDKLRCKLAKVTEKVSK